MLLLGLAAGAVTRLADIYTQILCSVFSELSVWILVGVVIVLGCDSRRRACLDIFLFCAGMLITYYLVAEYTNGIWGWSFVYGWAAFTLLTPVLAYLTWFVKSGGVFGRLISVGIILVTLISSVFYRVLRRPAFLRYHHLSCPGLPAVCKEEKIPFVTNGIFPM